MFSAQSEIHGTLTLQTGIAIIGSTCFGLDADCAFSVLIQILDIGTVTVFPIVTVVEDPFESQFMVFIDIKIKSRRITLTFTGDKVLAHLIIADIYFAILILFPHEFSIIRTGRSILIRSGEQHAQSVIEETIAVSET